MECNLKANLLRGSIWKRQEAGINGINTWHAQLEYVGILMDGIVWLLL